MISGYYNLEKIQTLNLDKLEQKVETIDSPIPRGVASGLRLIDVAIIQSKLDKIIQLVEEGGADLYSPLSSGSYRGYTPVYLAVLSGDLDVVDYILERGADINAPLLEGLHKGMTPFYIAAYLGKLEMVRYLVAMGADINTPLLKGDHEGMTPLFIAAQFSQLEIIRYLAGEGVNVNSPLTDGKKINFTPLTEALISNRREVVTCLIECGADIESPLPYGDYSRENMTPLFFAAHAGFLDMVRYLVEGGANVNAPIINGEYNNGFTPLYAATSRDRRDVVHYLMESGANALSPLTKGTEEGFSPLDAAVKYNHSLIIRDILMRVFDYKCRSNLVSLSQFFSEQKPGTLSALQKEMSAILSVLRTPLNEVLFLYFSLSSSATSLRMPTDILLEIAYHNFVRVVPCSYSSFHALAVGFQQQFDDKIARIENAHDALLARLINPIGKSAKRPRDMLDKTERPLKKARIDKVGLFSLPSSTRHIEDKSNESTMDAGAKIKR